MVLFLNKWLWKIIVSILLVILGYAIHASFPQEMCPYCLPLPELPPAYQKYDIIRLDEFQQNYHIRKFIQAWKNKDTYAICKQGPGIDTPASIFWITDKGKITRILVDHLDYTESGEKLYKIKEVDSVSLYSWVFSDDDNNGVRRTLVNIDPNNLMHEFVFRQCKDFFAFLFQSMFWSLVK